MQTITELKKFADDFAKALDALVEGVAVDARDEVALYLARYIELVPAVDERLRFCAALLEKGLRHEALGYEADEPALLEAVTLLDLAGRPQWQRWLEALKTLEFPEPQMPKTEAALELRDAQEQVLRLKPLLDQWRRFNLMNAPLPARIATLRQLRKQDPNNESWHESLKLHEKQRAMQIESDVKAAVAARDEQRLTELAQEFKAEWLESPPQRVVKAVQGALAAIRGSRIDGEIAQVAAGLAAALDAQDLEAGQRLRDRWNQLIAAKGAFEADDANVLRALPAVEWVERHDRLDLLVAEVWQSLDARPQSRQGRREWVRKLSRMRDEVEDLAEKLHDEIDQEPIERLRTRVARVAGDLQREEAGRRRLAMLSVAAATSIVLGTVITVVSVMRRREQIQQAVAAVDGQLRKVEAVAVDPAELPSPALPEWLTKEPAVAAKLSALQEAKQRETVRRQDFAKEAAKVTELVDALAKMKDAGTLDPWPEPFVETTKLLTSLQQSNLAKTADDSAILDKLAGRLRNAASRFQRAADDVFAGRVTALKDTLERLRATARRSRNSVGDQLAAIAKEVKELRSLAGEPGAPGAAGAFGDQRRVSRETALPLDPDQELERAIAALRADMTDLERYQVAEKGLAESLGNWKRYAAALESIAAEFGKQAAARDYAEAAKDAELWAGLDEWNRFVQEFRPVAQITAEDARAVAASIEQLKERAGRVKPVAEFVADYMPAIKSFADRQPAEIHGSLREWCGREWLGELAWVVSVSDDQKYYCVQKPRVGGRSFRYQRAWKDGGNWPAPKVQPVDSDLTDDMIQGSPQSRLARDLEAKELAAMATAGGIGFDELLADMSLRIVNAVDVDPCVRMVNLRKLLSTGRACSLSFQSPKVAALWEKLDDGAGAIPEMTVADIAEFLDPNRAENQTYNKVRRFAERILADAAGVLRQLRDAIRVERARLEAVAPAAYVCVGRLGRDVEGQLIAVTANGAAWSKGQDALVVRPDGGLGVVGSCGEPGRIELTARQPGLAGTPIFVRLGTKAGTAVPRK
jgi:hypothetical protein